MKDVNGKVYTFIVNSINADGTYIYKVDMFNASVANYLPQGSYIFTYTVYMKNGETASKTIPTILGPCPMPLTPVTPVSTNPVVTVVKDLVRTGGELKYGFLLMSLLSIFAIAGYKYFDAFKKEEN